MKKTTFLLTISFLLTGVFYAQDKMNSFDQNDVIRSTAFRVESMKDGSDCSVISYLVFEYNRTLTPRDDKNVGVFYYVSGRDCGEIFEETFSSMNHPMKGEEYNPLPAKTLDLDSFQNMNFTILKEVIGEGATKLYLILFHKDLETSDPRDDVFVGMDWVIDSGDPDSIVMPFKLGGIKDDLNTEPAYYNLIANHSYYKLREMIVNEKLIVEKLRNERKLRDITPEQPGIKKIKLKNTS